jgi:hypothetical protein
MPFSFVVVDQNQIGVEAVVATSAAECERHDLRLLIVHGAAMEWSKRTVNGKDPFPTFNNSLRVIAAHSERVVVGRAIAALWHEEIATGRPCTTIHDEDATLRFCSVLRRLHAGDDSELRDTICGAASELMPAAIDHWQKQPFKENLLRIRGELQSHLGDSRVKKLRFDGASGVVDWVTSSEGQSFVFQGIAARGVDDRTAYRLSVERSALGGFLSGMAALALYWLAFGGLESTVQTKIANDIQDLEYAVLGALSDSLLTKDRRLRTVYQAIAEGYRTRELLRLSVPLEASCTVAGRCSTTQP